MIAGLVVFGQSDWVGLSKVCQKTDAFQQRSRYLEEAGVECVADGTVSLKNSSVDFTALAGGE